MPGKKKEAKGKSASSGSKKKVTAQPKPAVAKAKDITISETCTSVQPQTSEAQSGKQTADQFSSAPLDGEFKQLFDKVDSKYHDYLQSVINHPIRQFQHPTVDEYLNQIAELGLARAVARAIDCRDYARGNSWEQARMNIMNAILPQPRLLKDVLKEGVLQNCPEAIKWYPEASGNPKEIVDVLRPVLKDNEPKNRWWAAIHLSRHMVDEDGLVDTLIEAMQSDWVAYRYENSSSGISGRGEAAKALARLGNKASHARKMLYAQLDSKGIEPADAAQVAGALLAITGEVDEIMDKVTKLAEGVLTSRRGLELHGGDRELLSTLRNLIGKWKQSGKAKSDEVNAKVELLEKEIKYHLNP